MVWPLITMGIGAAAGGAAGLLGRQSTTGFGEDFLNGLYYQRQLLSQLQSQSLAMTEPFFQQYSDFAVQESDLIAATLQSTAEVNPVFRALQNNLLSQLQSDPDGGNEVRTAVRSALAARGTLGSAASAVPEALAVTQFRTQQRQQTINNALNFLRGGSFTSTFGGAFSGNMAAGAPNFAMLAGAGAPGLQAGLQFGQASRALSAANDRNVFSGILSGAQLGLQAGGMMQQGGMQQQYLDILSGSGGGGGGGIPPFNPFP